MADSSWLADNWLSAIEIPGKRDGEIRINSPMPKFAKVFESLSSKFDRRAEDSPVPVIGKNVISCLHYRVAHEPALGVAPLRRLVS